MYYCRHRERSLRHFEAALEASNASPLLTACGLSPIPLPLTPGGVNLQYCVAAGQAALATASVQCADRTAQLAELAASVAQLAEASAGIRAPFEWLDGPLVEAMRAGDMILIDELNLAEDAVLERLNR
jgi:midasin